MFRETRFAALTVISELPLLPPKLPVIVLLPMFLAVARPLTVIETTAVEDCHCVTFVMSCLLPSEKLPIAVNCCASPSATVGLTGVMAMAVADAELTVRVVLPLIEPSVAVTVVLPEDTAVAKPMVGAVLLMLATEVAEDAQPTVPVMFFWLLSV